MPEDKELVDIVVGAGFRHPKLLIHLFTAGSHLHGARLPGKGDLDVAGVYLELPEQALGIDREQHFITGTAGDDVRNGANDEDYTLKTLSRWAFQAAKGNTTMLEYLFAPAPVCDPATLDSVWYTRILPHRDIFAASSHTTHFIGYGRSQYYRLRGEKGQSKDPVEDIPELDVVQRTTDFMLDAIQRLRAGTHTFPQISDEGLKLYRTMRGYNKGRGKHGQRPELESEFGFDTKMAMHMIRIMAQGLEYIQTGTMTFPRPEKDILIAIRKGEWTQKQVEEEYLRLEGELREAELTSPLPKAVNRAEVSRVITEAYFTQWHRQGYGLY